MRGNHLPVIPLFLVLSLLAPACEAVEYAGGTGEPNDPYLIATAEQFLAADFSVPGALFPAGLQHRSRPEGSRAA